MTIAERFLTIEKLYAESDIYAEKKEPFEPFDNANPYAVGKGFDFRQYMFESKQDFWQDIRFLTEAEIPNCFFVLPWDEYFNSREQLHKWLNENKKTAFAQEYLKDPNGFNIIYKKTFWELFAIILACRGADNVVDIAKPLLNIFVDCNRLGIFPAQCLVCNNIPIFEDAIIECDRKALAEKEEYWHIYLQKILSLQHFERN